MSRPIYSCITALTLSALMTLTVVAATDGSHDPTPVADGHWCC